MTDSRRSSRHGKDRGRPEDKHVEAMAQLWLEHQSQTWPDLVAKFRGAKSDGDLIQSMTLEFQARYGQPVKVRLHPWLPKALAVAYLRFSSDHSNPRSLAQQLVNVLLRANQEGHFIPWHCVFGDAAITGTIAARVAYQQAKEMVLAPGNDIVCLYVDDVGRASRDLVELLSLFRSLSHANKRAIAVSDALDTNSENARMLLTFKGLFVEQFIDQLRHKVSRGMKDCFRTGGVVTGKAFGYRMVDDHNADGSVKRSAKGKVVRKMEQDPAHVAEVRNIFDMFVNRKMSAHAIAKDLNERRVLHPRLWGATNIVQILTRHLYAGFEYWGKTSAKRDPETGKVITIRKDQKDWLPRRELPELAIIPEELFNQAQERLALLKQRYQERKSDQPKQSRTDLHPTILIRPICHSCRWPVNLVQSLGSGYASLKCTRSFDKTSPCGKLGCKSVSLINECVLAVLRDRVFTPEFLNRLLEAANTRLMELASLPKEDTGPLKERISEIGAEERRLSERLAGRSSDGLDILFDRLKELAACKKRLQEELAAMESSNRFIPEPMGPHDMVNLLKDLEGLLHLSVAESATVLRRVLGDVVAEPSETKSKRGNAWVLRFTINGAALMAETSRRANYQTADTWEFLCDRGWIMPGMQEIVVEVSDAYLNDRQRKKAKE